jgi:hypothetical protein
MTDASASAQLLLFVAKELQGTFAHIGRAMTEYSQTGKLPESLFNSTDVGKAAGPKRKKEKKDRPKRKPSAFNNFVKEKIAELRSEGPAQGNNGTSRMFTSTVAWVPIESQSAIIRNIGGITGACCLISFLKSPFGRLRNK